MPITPRSRSLATDLDEQTQLGDVYIDGLRRAQLRLSMTALALMSAAIGGFSGLLLLVPSTRSLTIGGVPFAWLVLGVVIYPAAWLLARGYVHQAERLEQNFTDIVETDERSSSASSPNELSPNESSTNESSPSPSSAP